MCIRCQRARTGRAPTSKSCSRFYAARLKDFSVSDADAERERNVVRQEHDWRVGGRPFVRLARKLDRLLVPDHPSGQWTIGTAEDIEGFTLENARAFHRAWYAINNVDFVVMADIDPVALKDIADRALAGLAPRPLPPRASAKQPAIVNGRTDIVEQDSAIRRPGLYFKKLIRMEEGDVQAMGAARTLVTSFLASRLPGSLFDAIVDNGKLAAGTPSIGFSRVAPKTYTLTIGADAAPDVAPEALLDGDHRLCRATCRLRSVGGNGCAPQDAVCRRPGSRRQGSAADL